MWVSTFHAACVRILRAHADRLGYRKSFTIYDDTDSRRLVEHILRDLNIDAKKLPARSVQAAISGAKAELLEADAYADAGALGLRAAHRRRLRGVRAAPVARRRPWTSTTCCSSRCKLFQAAPDVLDGVPHSGSSTCSSTSSRTPTGPRTRSCSCWRPSTTTSASSATATSRSIGWRGADIRNIFEFEEAFPDAAVIPLEQNYRSTKTILDAANAVIANNVTRVPKELWTEGERGEPDRPLPGRGRVRRGGLGGDGDRPPARVEGLRYGDVAVFYRTNAQSRAFEEELVRAAIPYKVVGGTRFYDRREVKDLLAYLRLLAQSLRRGVRPAHRERAPPGRGRDLGRPPRRLGAQPTVARSSTPSTTRRRPG